MASGQQTTTIPSVPIQTPMFDASGNLTRPWILFFQQTSPVPVFTRTLVIGNTAVGNGIADPVVVQQGGTAISVLAVLGQAITADLVVRINQVIKGVSQPIITCDVPFKTPVNTPVVFTAFTASPQTLTANAALTFDITASDGSAGNVASFTLLWA